MEEDVTATRIGVLEARDDAQQGGLARARRPEQRDKFAAFNVQVHAIEGGERTEGFADL